MTDDRSVLEEKIDIGRIATFLHSFFPQYTKQELVAKLVEFVPLGECTCTLCRNAKFPECMGCTTK